VLIDDIVELLSRQEGNLNDALLKTKVLLHTLGRRDLVEWVNSELNGYAEEAHVPDYRVISARVLANLVSISFRAEGHPIPIDHLNLEEKDRLLRHEMRQPVGVLEDRKDGSKFILPLPMEANGRLGKTLAGGVHINNAWCELNEQEIDRIVINVRSRLLDFVLELRDALGENVPDSEIREKSKGLDTSAMFQHAIFGPNATVVVGGGHARIHVTVRQGDLEALERALEQAGVPAREIVELKGALAEDKAEGRSSLDGKTGQWFTRLLTKASTGAVDVGVEVVSSTVAKALTTYLGLA